MGGGQGVRGQRSAAHTHVHAQLLTVVHRQDLPAVHLHEAAERKPSVLHPSLLCPPQGDALVTRGRETGGRLDEADGGTEPGTHLVVVVVHQASDHVDLPGVQLVQHVGGVGGQVDQLLLAQDVAVVLRPEANVLQRTLARQAHTQDNASPVMERSRVTTVTHFCAKPGSECSSTWRLIG